MMSTAESISFPFVLISSPTQRQFRYSGTFRYVLPHVHQFVETIFPPSIPKFPLFPFSHPGSAIGSIKIRLGTFLSIPSGKPRFRTPISTFTSQRTSVSTFLSRTIPAALCRTVLPYTPADSPAVLYAKDPLRFDLLSLHKQFNVSPFLPFELGDFLRYPY